MAEKRNIFLVGPMGAGKSTIGRQLAQQLNMDFVDSDAVIEERAGADISWIFDYTNSHCCTTFSRGKTLIKTIIKRKTGTPKALFC